MRTTVPGLRKAGDEYGRRMRVVDVRTRRSFAVRAGRGHELAKAGAVGLTSILAACAPLGCAQGVSSPFEPWQSSEDTQPSTDVDEFVSIDPDLTQEDDDSETSSAIDTEKRCRNVDFLFVIDDSSSMADEQAAMRAAIPAFVDAIENELELSSLHLGVVATNVYAGSPSNCLDLGGLITQSNAGRCGPFEEGHSYITEADEDIADAFACIADLGVTGSGDERPMEAMIEALSGEIECNEGFLRDDALLVVTVITDEDDDEEEGKDDVGSWGEPSDWHAAVIEAKDGYPEHAVALGLIGMLRPNECPDEDIDPGEGAQYSPRLAEFFEHFGHRGFVGDVCMPNYEPFFKSVMASINQACIEVDPPAR